jgi:hypothetical protein
MKENSVIDKIVWETVRILTKEWNNTWGAVAEHNHKRAHHFLDQGAIQSMYNQTTYFSSKMPISNYDY